MRDCEKCAEIDTLKVKLGQAQAVYNSLIDGAAKDTETINYLKHWNEQIEKQHKKDMQTLNSKLAMATEALTEIEKSGWKSSGDDWGLFAEDALKKLSEI